jgi:protein SCO1/2
VLLVSAFSAGLGVAWVKLRVPAPAGATPVAAAARPAVAGDFTLLDAAARPVRWDEINGRVQLVFFGFTHCPEACPTTLTNASQAIAGLDAAGLRVVFISVDPERDSPQRVGEYIAGFGPQVVGYTGDAAGVAAAAAAFHVFYEKLPPMPDGGYMVNHTASLFLLGPGDEILEIIPYGTGPADIADILRRHGVASGRAE